MPDVNRQRNRCRDCDALFDPERPIYAGSKYTSRRLPCAVAHQKKANDKHRKHRKHRKNRKTKKMPDLGGDNYANVIMRATERWDRDYPEASGREEE